MAAMANERTPAETGDAASRLPAAGSSFYTAMRILPAGQRDAMYAIYAFCRAVDDIADGTTPRAPRHTALELWRERIDRLFHGEVSKATADLEEPTRRFGLRRDDFRAVIDGMAMDVDADLRAPDWATLDLYCDRVASAVGRLSVRVFGLDPKPGDELAYHLGRALQLTNILRDLDEDAAMGRLYLPREALAAAGIDFEGRAPAEVLRQSGLGKACDEVAARAARHFAEASRVMAKCPRRGVRAPRLMEAAYRQILTRLRARGWEPPREPVRISKVRLAPALLRYGIV
jgi:presqualene diphosphate synthase